MYYDTDPPSFGVRCSGTAKSYMLYTRLPFSNAPVRLALGDAQKISLAVARKKAREWLDLIEQGKDPREVAQSAARIAEHKNSWIVSRSAGTKILWTFYLKSFLGMANIPRN